MEELNLSLEEIDTIIMELCRIRNQIVEKLPTPINEDWIEEMAEAYKNVRPKVCLLYTSPSPRD